jgi:MFS family permease
MSSRRLVASMCAAEVLTMVGVFAFPALLPEFVARWGLTNSEAGWIAGVYFAAYAVAAPILLALSDRVDARQLYLGGVALAGASALGFALFASGFWTALLLRGFAGAALAATYMPGLRVIVDRYRGDRPSRAVAFYTASFSLGTAVSFLVVGWVAGRFGWPAAFLAAALATVPAFGLAWSLPAAPPPGCAMAGPPAVPAAAVLDFRPILRNRRALGYILAYGAHCWELFTLRSWLVAFLVAAGGGLAAGGVAAPSPTAVATLSGLVAMGASLAGNELALALGRRRAIALAAVASATIAVGIGFAQPLAYPVVAVLVLLYTLAVQLDSAALTAGVVAAAAPGRQGATLALHALVGFGLAGVGPIVFGLVLDAAGGASRTLAWGLAFLGVAGVAVLVVPALRLADRD